MKTNMMLVGLMLVSTIILAQHRTPDSKAMAVRRSDKMKTELSLNDDQYARVKAINEKFASSHVKLMSDTSLTVGTARKRREKLRADQEAQLKSVLTEAQQTKWTELKAKKSEERKKHKRGEGNKG